MAFRKSFRVTRVGKLFLCKVPDGNILAPLGHSDSEELPGMPCNMTVVIGFTHTHTYNYTWTKKQFV